MTKYCDKCQKIVADKKTKAAKRDLCNCEIVTNIEVAQQSVEDVEDDKQTSSQDSGNTEDNENKSGKSSSSKSNKKQPSVLLSTINPDLWMGLQVRVLKAAVTNVGEIGTVLKSGNGWVNLKTKTGQQAKRAYHLELIDPPPVEPSKASNVTIAATAASTTQSTTTTTAAAVGSKRKAVDDAVAIEPEATIEETKVEVIEKPNSKSTNNAENRRKSASNGASTTTIVTFQQDEIIQEDDTKSVKSSKSEHLPPAPAPDPAPLSPKRSSTRNVKRKIDDSTVAVVVRDEDINNNSILSINATEQEDNANTMSRRSRSQSFSDNDPNNQSTTNPTTASATTATAGIANPHPPAPPIKVTSSGRAVKSSIALTPLHEMPKKSQPRKPPTYNTTNATTSSNPKSSTTTAKSSTGSNGHAAGGSKKTDKEHHGSTSPVPNGATTSSTTHNNDTATATSTAANITTTNGFSAFASNGPKLNALLCEVKRSIVVKYVERHQEKIKNRPNLLQWSLKINSKCIDVEYEKSIARKVIYNSFCDSCFCENLVDSQTCYNELCHASPIYWGKSGCRGVPPALSLSDLSMSYHNNNNNNGACESERTMGNTTTSTRSVHENDNENEGNLSGRSHSNTSTTNNHNHGNNNGIQSCDATPILTTFDPNSTTNTTSNNKVASNIATLLTSNMTPRSRKMKLMKSPGGGVLGGPTGSIGGSGSGFMSPRRRNSIHNGDKDAHNINNNNPNIITHAKYHECGPYPTGGSSSSMSQLSSLPETINLQKDIYSSTQHIYKSSVDTTAINHYLLYAGKQIISVDTTPSAGIYTSALDTNTSVVIKSENSHKNDNAESKLLDSDRMELEAGILPDLPDNSITNLPEITITTNGQHDDSSNNSDKNNNENQNDILNIPITSSTMEECHTTDKNNLEDTSYQSQTTMLVVE